MDEQEAVRRKLPLRAALAILAAGGSLTAWNAGAASAMSCESLKSLQLTETTILSADTVRGPSFTPPGSTTPIGNLPAFCRVAAVIQPQINFEVWLPLSGWNGKFQGTGNGGYNGAIVYSALASGVQRNYATANSDLGHKSSTPHWAIGRPDLIVDQGYRAQHETTLKGKAITRAFYGRHEARSYWTGCSSGGWQGMTEAQMFPDDYDGIVAGAPAFEVIHLHAQSLYSYFQNLNIVPAKLPLVTSAILTACDANDGVVSGAGAGSRSTARSSRST